jgi:hypothetical protein
MEKIILLTDAQQIETSTVDFGCYLAKLTQSELVGVLLKDPLYKNKVPEYQGIFNSGKLQTSAKETVLETKDPTLHFMEATRKHQIRSEAFVDEGTPEVISLYESRFADLVVLAPDLSFTGGTEGIPSSFVRYMLFKSECPIVLAPRTFNNISQIVFCYDGSPSSLFAIKQFTYLFPQYKNVPIIVLVIRSSTVVDKEEKYDRLLAWLTAHYEQLELRFLYGDVREELFPFFLNKKDTFIVMGAFGRNLISYMARKSVSEKVIKIIDLPLFISHH